MKPVKPCIFCWKDSCCVVDVDVQLVNGRRIDHRSVPLCGHCYGKTRKKKLTAADIHERLVELEEMRMV